MHAASTQFFLLWRDHFYFKRKATTVLLNVLMRKRKETTSKVFGSWTYMLQRDNRIHRQIGIWEQRAAACTWDSWLGHCTSDKEKRIISWQMRGRCDRKLEHRVFLSWERVSFSLRRQRIRVIKMRQRMKERSQFVALDSFRETVGLLRRQRCLLDKSKLVVERTRITRATARLLENSKAAKHQRKVLLMLLRRRASKLVHQAWVEWELRLQSKKRMQEAFQKAMQSRDD